MMLELVEQRAQAMFIGAIVARAMGSDIEIETPDRVRENFIDLLNKPPREVDEDADILMRALFPNR